MRIAMFTNTYLPHVGGVAQSVHRFVTSFREMGHEVMVVAPEFDGTPEAEDGVIRVGAIQNFNGSDFSVVLPVFGAANEALDEFQPDLVHSHHPFLLGDSALRYAASRQLPLVFTHHTMYEQYTHYVPVDATAMAQAVIDLTMGYCNRCTYVIAPSESVKRILQRRGIMTPTIVVPTGVDIRRFAQGDGAPIREELGIPSDAYAPGHLGRLAPEKNLDFMTEAVVKFLRARPSAHFILVGGGPSGESMKSAFSEAGVLERVHFAGKRSGQDLVNAYHAMDAFVFASRSETQGMVLVEAMAAGKPVLALDADAVRDVVRDNQNGKLLMEEDPSRLAQAIAWYAELTPDQQQMLKKGALETAEKFSTDACARRALDVYELAIQVHELTTEPDNSEWSGLLRAIDEEWTIWSNRVSLAYSLLTGAATSDDSTREHSS